MKTTEAVLEFVIVGVLIALLTLVAAHLAAAGWLTVIKQEIRDSVPGAGQNPMARDGFLYLALLSLCYVAGLGVNTLTKWFFRARVGWIRSRLLEAYSDSPGLRSAVAKLRLGVTEPECFDPLLSQGRLSKFLLRWSGWAPNGPGRTNAALLKKRYRVIGQLPFRSMRTSPAAFADFSSHRSTVRISRNAFAILAISTALAILAGHQGHPWLIVTLPLCVFAYYTLLAREKWYALDSVKYAISEDPSNFPKVKAAIFDLGGVLIPDVRENLFPRIAASHPNIRKFATEISDDIWAHAAVTEFSAPELWARIKNAFEVKTADHRRPFRRGDLLDQDLDTMLDDILATANMGVIHLVEELRASGIPTLLLTNNTSYWLKRSTQMHRLDDLFDYTIASCDIGTCKPDPRMFREASHALGVPPAQTLFVDDRLANCRTAALMGFRAVRYHDEPTLRRTLRGLGLAVK